MLEPLTPFDPASMSRRFAELDAYFRAVIAQRRADPGPDLISALAHRATIRRWTTTRSWR